MIIINLQQNSKDGWVSFEDLSNTTGSNEDNINLQLFMLRHHLQSTLKNCKGVSKLVNFNDSFLRLEIQHFSIYRNGKLEQSSDYHR